MALAVAAWILLTSVGLLLLGLPEQGSRVFSISEDHGPSAIDLIGVVVLLAAWTIPAVVIWRGRRALWHSRAGASLRALVVVILLILLAVSVLGDLGSLWVAPALLLALVQVLAFISVVRSLGTSSAGRGSGR